MIFDNNPVVEMLSVSKMRWKSQNCSVLPRPFSALAFRVCGESRILANVKEIFVKQKDVLYLPQNIAYKAEYNETELIVFHFKTLYSDDKIRVFSPKNTQELEELFLKSCILWEQKMPGYKNYVMSCFYKIIGRLNTSEIAPLPENFVNAFVYMNKNFCNSDISINEICRQFYISETYFRVLFKSYYGVTPIQYLTDLRLENAIDLILKGTAIQSSALDSGFNDSKYFARVVKKKYGCNPKNLKN